MATNKNKLAAADVLDCVFDVVFQLGIRGFEMEIFNKPFRAYKYATGF